MAYDKKDLKALKKKLSKENPGALNVNRKTVKRTIKRSSDWEVQKKVVQWNYSVNDLVEYKFTNKIGIIVADKQFFGKKVEKNYFWVLLENHVQKVEGQHIKKL